MRELEGSLGCPIHLVYVSCTSGSAQRPPVSYVLVGRAAVVTLDERLKGREREVADILLHSVPGVEAVYGKISTEGEHRTQQLVHLAGRRLEKTVLVENRLRLPVYLGKVYVNPRLSAEHTRIARLVRPGERVLDMFAGIGGFTLNIAARGDASLVTANDVNRYAVKSLIEALLLNKRMIKSPVLVLNMDAARLTTALQPGFNRIIMNLPHRAVEFLPAALKLCSKEHCVIHLYTVARSPEEASRNLEQRFPSLARAIVAVVRVLDYAPRKYIFRLDIELQHDMESKAPREARSEKPPH